MVSAEVIFVREFSEHTKSYLFKAHQQSTQWPTVLFQINVIKLGVTSNNLNNLTFGGGTIAIMVWLWPNGSKTINWRGYSHLNGGSAFCLTRLQSVSIAVNWRLPTTPPTVPAWCSRSAYYAINRFLSLPAFTPARTATYGATWLSFA